MKKILFFILFSGILAVGCSKDGENEDKKGNENTPENTSVVGVWQFQKEISFQNGKEEKALPISVEKNECLTKETRNFTTEGKYIRHTHDFNDKKNECEDLGEQEFSYTISENKIIYTELNQKVTLFFEVKDKTLVLKQVYEGGETHYYFTRK